MAWASDALGDRAAAQQNIAESLRLVPDDEDLKSLYDHFFLADAPAAHRVKRYLELAGRASEEVRGHFLTMASRSSIEAGDFAEAIDYAQRAVDLDRAVGGERSFNVARDLNDLGMALVAGGHFAQASLVLQESVDIYQKAQTSHSDSAIPLLHLGRVLTEQARESSPPNRELLARARKTLDHAIRLQIKAAPDSADHASMLYAMGDVFLYSDDPERALAKFREAAGIDRAVHGETHREVALDIARIMQAQLTLDDPDGALQSFRPIKRCDRQVGTRRPGHRNPPALHAGDCLDGAARRPDPSEGRTLRDAWTAFDAVTCEGCRRAASRVGALDRA